jgi:LysR family glycine cleavage system transcriptional activator
MAVESSRLPLNALRVFEAVATHLSFTAAAKELGVTTAAVSAQVKSLEADIGVPLFRRHTRAVALTQEGAELLPGVRRGLDELRRGVDRIRRERVGGMLNLSVPSEFLQRWLLPRIGEFTRQHPEIEVRFGPRERRSTSAGTISTPPSSTVLAPGRDSSRSACSTSGYSPSAAQPCSRSSDPSTP